MRRQQPVSQCIAGWRSPRRWKALATAICALLGSNAAEASTRLVTSCADDGSAATLRSVAAAALDGDQIDLHSQLNCSKITLTQGGVSMAHDVTLVGPSDNSLVIDGNSFGRVLESSAPHYLAVNHLVIQKGLAVGANAGGCIYAAHELRMDNTTVTECKHTGTLMRGGAVAAGSVRLVGSRVSNSQIYPCCAGSVARGGGIYTAGTLTCIDSTISHNRIEGADARAAAFEAHAAATLTRCTIDSNYSHGGSTAGESIYMAGFAPITITSSTISGNSGDNSANVAIRATGGVAFYNSTVAFNANGVYSSGDVYAQSSIFANNARYDIFIGDEHNQIVGADNFVTNINTGQIPQGVIVAGDNPHLSPLAYHGGTTRTHALLASSSAINLGNNGAMSATDQRGAPREAPSGKPDIGAYERQPGDDEIFYDGFDLAP